MNKCTLEIYNFKDFYNPKLISYFKFKTVTDMENIDKVIYYKCLKSKDLYRDTYYKNGFRIRNMKNKNYSIIIL